ncbi:hypothetical protein GRX01_09810 [Halobaculum sp. WSA2]|uniref:Uncharacterized protein n=1 Tax=Halobaculum saliterrae TaxID=2073113 RepID=A0A6B0T078_9EURY|nr:DUF5799 family protein [Halobaculum saliterrae]MXR41630.1 hypothetical protein [Halobaculum saliterrae]
MSDWTDAIVGERMTVDREFNDRVRQSEFSNQEWGLIMTAVEFEIEDADDPESARVVADTSKLPQIMPELDNISQQMGAMAGGGSDGGSSNGAFGEIVSDIKDAILGGGGGGGVDDQKLEAAERLTQEYADELQRHLESKGKFDQVRLAYQE